MYQEGAKKRATQDHIYILHSLQARVKTIRSNSNP